MPLSRLPRLSLSQRLLGLLLLAGLLIGLAMAVAGRLSARLDPEPARAVPPPTVQVVSLQAQPLRTLRRYRGSVVAERRMLVSARITGRVLSIPLREGERVESGQLLLRLDDEELRRELERLTAVSSRLESELSLARRELERHQDLFQRQHIPERQLDEARQRVQGLETQNRETRAALALARTRLAYTEERAPFSGIVSRVEINEGDLATVGRGMIEVVALDGLKAVLSVPQRDVAMLQQGQPLRLEVDGLDGEWSTPLARVYPTLEPISRHATVAAYFPASDPALLPWPGMAVTAHVALTHHPEAIRVPLHAVHHGGGESWVFVLEGELARRRVIDTADSQDGLLHVTRGLQPGEWLITSADPRLRDGLKVVAQASRISAEQP